MLQVEASLALIPSQELTQNLRTCNSIQGRTCKRPGPHSMSSADTEIEQQQQLEGVPVNLPLLLTIRYWQLALQLDATCILMRRERDVRGTLGATRSDW